MAYPHEPSFPFRRQLFVLLTGGSLLGFMMAIGGSDPQRLFGTAFLAGGVLFSYAAMRLFVALLCTPLAATHRRLVRMWGLIWFYGPIPLALTLFLLGSTRQGAGLPSSAYLAILLAAATAWSAGAVPALRMSESHSH